MDPFSFKLGQVPVSILEMLCKSLSNSADSNQTGIQELSDLGLHFAWTESDYDYLEKVCYIKLKCKGTLGKKIPGEYRG